MKKKLKKLPKFKNEDQERNFWATHDTTDYFDWSKAKVVHFPDLKPSTKAISMRLPIWLLSDIQIMANKRDVPYQSLIKTILADRAKQERSR